MELYIRSQNKSVLVNINNIFIDKTACDDKTISSVDASGGKFILGCYKSNERALEILNEIEYKIKHMYVLENCKLPKSSCVEQRLAMDEFNVYYMPKE